MKLHKATTINIDGFEGNEIKSNTFILSELEKIADDETITQSDVVEADVVFDSYMKYENLGEITEEEINVLRKFKILAE